MTEHITNQIIAFPSFLFRCRGTSTKPASTILPSLTNKPRPSEKLLQFEKNQKPFCFKSFFSTFAVQIFRKLSTINFNIFSGYTAPCNLWLFGASLRIVQRERERERERE